MLAEFETAISRERFRPFVQLAQGDLSVALAAYQLNILLATQFGPAIHMWEICLRNRLDSALVQGFGEAWHLQSERRNRSFAKKELSSLHKATVHVARHQPGMTPRRSQVVTELGAGFWVSLLSRSYSANPRFGSLLRTVVFPKAEIPLAQLHSTAENIRMLRNRIAHHEPVLWLELDRSWFGTREMIGLLSASALACLRQCESNSPAITRWRVLKPWIMARGCEPFSMTEHQPVLMGLHD
jgi:hypothetical protein